MKLKGVSFESLYHHAIENYLNMLTKRLGFNTQIHLGIKWHHYNLSLRWKLFK